MKRKGAKTQRVDRYATGRQFQLEKKCTSTVLKRINAEAGRQGDAEIWVPIVAIVAVVSAVGENVI
jgi:hypothetical protein